MTPLAEIVDVSKRYGVVEAVRGMSLTLPPRQTIALVGHNGAGKTTLLKMMLGLVTPTTGTIRVLGEDPARADFAARRHLGFLPENVSFNPALTGREILAFYARLKKEPAASLATLLDRVGLTHAADRRVGTYSKGMRQRLGLAQAFIGAPQLLLLDEPTTGLDPVLRTEFYELVAALRARGGTILLSSHALTEIEERTDRVVVMNRGAVLAEGSMEDLRAIARLPARIRVRVAAGGFEKIVQLLGEGQLSQQDGGRLIELEARPAESIELLRRITAPGLPIEDVAVMPAGLDELYAHFLRIGVRQ